MKVIAVGSTDEEIVFLKSMEPAPGLFASCVISF